MLSIQRTRLCTLDKSSQFDMAQAGVCGGTKTRAGQAETLSSSTLHHKSRATGHARTPRRQLSAARSVSVRGRRATRTQGQGSKPRGPQTSRLSAPHCCSSRTSCDNGTIDNDPSAGSPTETLLRLLLPLNAQVWESSQKCPGDPRRLRSKYLTKTFNR